MSDQIRKSFKEGDDIRDAGLTAPADVERFDDLVYGSDPKWQVLDVYRPKNQKGKMLPVIVSVHGGGWVYGDKERYQYYTMSLAQRGFAVVNFTYRLAPEFKFPAPAEDTNLVMQWIVKHAMEYGMDTDHVFAVGDSAGAHLLGMYSCILTNPGYAAQFSFRTPEGFSLKAIALNCGVYEMKKEDHPDDMTTGDLMQDYLPGGGTAAEYRMISITDHVTTDFPPTFLMTAPKDFLRDQAPVMAKRLQSLDVTFCYRFFADPEKELGHVFHCNMKSEYAKMINDEECSFFREFC